MSDSTVFSSKGGPGEQEIKLAYHSLKEAGLLFQYLEQELVPKLQGMGGTASSAKSPLAKLPVEYQAEFLRAMALQACAQAQEVTLHRALALRPQYTWTLISSIAHDTCCKFREAAAALMPVAQGLQSSRLSKTVYYLVAKEHLYQGVAMTALASTFVEAESGQERPASGFKPGHGLVCLTAALEALNNGLEQAKKFEQCKPVTTTTRVFVADQFHQVIQFVGAFQQALKHQNDTVYYVTPPTTVPALPPPRVSALSMPATWFWQPLQPPSCWSPALCSLYDVGRRSPLVISNSLTSFSPSSDDPQAATAADDENHEDKLDENTKSDCLIL